MPPRLPPPEGTWATDWIETDFAEERLADNLSNFAVLLEDFLHNTSDPDTEQLRELIVLLSEQQKSSQEMPVDVVSGSI